MNSILSNLPKLVIGVKKRLGRGLGSNKGAKSTRGTSRHQKARQSIPLHFEGGQGRLVKRFPLLRGKGKNNSKRPDAVIVDVKYLKAFKDGDVVTMDSLVKKNVTDNKALKRGVKIIGNGTVEKKLTVQVPVSQSAKKSIEKAGGTVEIKP